MVDEAHALGVLGPGGRGLCRERGLSPDVLVGTMGKALGLQGAFVTGAHSLRLFLWNRARSLVFSTALSPAVASGGSRERGLEGAGCGWGAAGARPGGIPFEAGAGKAGLGRAWRRPRGARRTGSRFLRRWVVGSSARARCRRSGDPPPHRSGSYLAAPAHGDGRCLGRGGRLSARRVSPVSLMSGDMGRGSRGGGTSGVSRSPWERSWCAQRRGSRGCFPRGGPRYGNRHRQDVRDGGDHQGVGGHDRPAGGGAQADRHGCR